MLGLRRIMGCKNKFFSKPLPRTPDELQLFSADIEGERISRKKQQQRDDSCLCCCGFYRCDDDRQQYGYGCKNNDQMPRSPDRIWQDPACDECCEYWQYRKDPE